MKDDLHARDIFDDAATAFELKVCEEADRERIRREARRRVRADERAEIHAPEILTLRERLARPRPVARWRIHGWQPRESRVILTAQFKAGKTTLVGGLLRSLVDGDDWLNRDRVEVVDGTVALLDTEMGAAHVDDWLRDQGIKHDDRVLPIPMRGQSAALDLVDPQTRSEWARRFRAARVRYLVLDCLRPVLDALGLDEHGEAGRFLVAFDALLAEAEIPEACLVHHMGHTGERARGDSRLRDWPDAEWRLVRQDDDPSSPRYITAFGRDVDQPEARLDYDPQTRRLSIAGGSRKDRKAEDALDAIREVLTGATEAMSGRALKQALADSEHARDTIDAALRLGVRTGVLTVTDGPRKAKLYSSVRVSGSVRPVSGKHSIECPAASIEADTRSLTQSQSVSGFSFDPHNAFGKVPS